MALTRQQRVEALELGLTAEEYEGAPSYHLTVKQRAMAKKMGILPERYAAHRNQAASHDDLALTQAHMMRSLAATTTVPGAAEKLAALADKALEDNQ